MPDRLISEQALGAIQHVLRETSTLPGESAISRIEWANSLAALPPGQPVPSEASESATLTEVPEADHVENVG